MSRPYYQMTCLPLSNKNERIIIINDNKKKTEKTTECTLNKHVSKETWKKNDRAINSTKKKENESFLSTCAPQFFFLLRMNE